MNIDRKFQKEILSYLLEKYPSYEGAREHFVGLFNADSDRYVANIDYLQRHDLVEDGVSLSFSSDGFPLVAIHAFPKITEKGIDFMLEDGGLSAILHVQTVKLHPDTVKALLEDRLLQADIPDSDKASLLDQIRDLPEASAKILLDKLLDKGLDLLLGNATNLLSML